MRANYLDCEYCRKPMERRDVVAVVKGKGQFAFGHRGECSKAIRDGIEVYQLNIDDVLQSSR